MNQARTRALRGQLSFAGILIGCIGCVIITASSVYTALKMGALPWPTIFTSITALVLLRALGHTSLNEANITQVIMSAGSMVAGGLAFTIPGIWILGLADEVSWQEMLAVALAGTLLGLVCTALIRKRFVEDSDLEYPIGTAAAETLLASTAGGSTGRKLFGRWRSLGSGRFFAMCSALFRRWWPRCPSREFRSVSRPRPCASRSGSLLGAARLHGGWSALCWAASASSWAALQRGCGTWELRKAS